ncbi:flavoprotein [Lysinibacillus sphaericus]
MNDTFEGFLEEFLAAWKKSSITEMERFISLDYQAREISNGDMFDFGYEDSINGWEQGFQFVNENEARWDINQLFTLPLKEDEVMAVLSATIIIEGNSMATANMFFNTFKNVEGSGWKLVRSYIEAGVPVENVHKMALKKKGLS